MPYYHLSYRGIERPFPLLEAANIIDYTIFSPPVIMALVLGNEKRAAPEPITIKQAMIYLKGVSWFKKASMASPVVVNAIPVEATDRGSILSESLPATGERIAILMTWVYSNTKGSMLLIVLFYASAVASAVIVRNCPKWLTTTVSYS